VFLYALMEHIAMVNEMLLMMSGDIEPNPGPSEYFYIFCYSGVSEAPQGVEWPLDTMSEATHR